MAESSRAEPRVYRYFLTGEEFLTYARGNWKGLGLHGSTEVDPEIMVHMHMRASQRGLELQLRQAMPRKAGLWHRLGRLFGGGNQPRRKIGSVMGDAPGFAPADIQTGEEPDLAQLTAMPWSMTCQALTENRLHIVLYGDRRPDSLVFSGTLTRA